VVAGDKSSRLIFKSLAVLFVTKARRITFSWYQYQSCEYPILPKEGGFIYLFGNQFIQILLLILKCLIFHSIKPCLSLEPFHIVIAFLSAGVALFAGIVSLFIGLHKDGERTDLVFGILCLAIFIYFLCPPMGFIIFDKAPYSLDIIIKRVFNFIFFSTFPWFTYFYTGFKKKTIPILVGAVTLVTYFLMIFASKDTRTPVWVFTALISIGLSIVYGFIAVGYQFKYGSKSSAKWFQFAMFVYLFLFIISTIYQTNIEYFIAKFQRKIFYPINLFPLSFILIMGVRLRANSLEKFRLEKIVRLKNLQWDSLMQNLELVIVHFDVNGKLSYINPYGVQLLNYKNATELIGKNWFEYFLPLGKNGRVKELFQKAIDQGQATTHFSNVIVTSDGVEKNVDWITELTLDGNGRVSDLVSFGNDVTERENAYQRIEVLKSELEKENLMLKGEPLPPWMQNEIIGKSDAIVYAIHKATKVALTQATVLLEGETGVGKELFSDLIQRNSLRKMKPFVKVNCGALPSELVEDELFGHEKGAFTGAVMARKGRFEIADGGTIFLDEIGELPLILQPKLLRVLQNGEFERIGGQQTIKVDVRVIAATNRDLASEIKAGRFREDLFYRLNVFPITIPALRDRKEDIPMLMQFFVESESKKHGKMFKNITKTDIHHLHNYEWPGNIRELRNVIERAVIISETGTLRLDLFSDSPRDTARQNNPKSLEDLEKEHITKALQDSNWRISGEGGAAEKLVINPSTLRSRIKKLNILKSSSKEAL
jgi:formate hydrogenlyase transcriptional activator